MANGIIIEGDKEFKEILKQLPRKLENRVLRDVSRVGGRVIVKTARQMVQIPGQLGKHFRSDIGVRTDKGNKAGVKVNVGIKERSNSRGKTYKSGVAGRHFIEGTKRKPRFTNGKKLYRGKVGETFDDPILKAGQRDGRKAMDEMQKQVVSIIQKHINKLAKK